MMASPCVAVSMRVLSPMSPRAGMVNSRCAKPIPRIHAHGLAAAIAHQFHHRPRRFFSGTSTTKYSIGKPATARLPPCSVITCGLPIDSSYPSRPHILHQNAQMEQPRGPKRFNASLLVVSSTFSCARVALQLLERAVHARCD